MEPNFPPFDFCLHVFAACMFFVCSVSSYTFIYFDSAKEIRMQNCTWDSQTSHPSHPEQVLSWALPKEELSKRIVPMVWTQALIKSFLLSSGWLAISWYYSAFAFHAITMQRTPNFSTVICKLLATNHDGQTFQQALPWTLPNEEKICPYDLCSSLDDCDAETK